MELTYPSPYPEEDELGVRLPVVAQHGGHHWTARLLYRVEAAHEWVLTWTDGINEWLEEYDQPWHALARLAVLTAAVEQDVFLVHDADRPGEQAAFVAEVEHFVSRTVHASSCAPGCDGTDPVNHQVDGDDGDDRRST